MNEPEVYEGQLVAAYSGDDLIVMLDLKVESLHKKMRIRLSGVDTPNGIGASPESEAGRIRADVLKMCRNKQLRVTIVNKQSTKWIAVVEVNRDGELFNINNDLISKGYEFKRERTE
jgi:hypothetical protein